MTEYFSRCTGDGCKQFTKCLRYTVPIRDDLFYFVKPPCTAAYCEYYVDKEHPSLMDE